MTCPDENSLAHLLDGTLPAAARQAIEHHLDGCGTCSGVVSELARIVAPDVEHHICTACGTSYPAVGTCGGDGAEIRTTNDPLLGSDVGAYRFVRPLGEGGMARVYVGLQRDVASRVAIKVINRDHAEDPELTKRFLVEARAVNRIQHRGIVKVLDLVRLPDGRPAIVMELIEGPTLRHRIGDVSVRALVEIMIAVLDALAAAHAIGIVHRDLKPDNIVLSPTGPRILDFGIAKVVNPPLGHTAPRTRTGALLGTPEYMAPEQVLGMAADARSDLYSAGIVLFEALTGARPFRGATDFEVMRGQLEVPAPNVCTLRPDAPIALGLAISRALEKQPEQRFATAGDMAAALRETCTALPELQTRAALGAQPQVRGRSRIAALVASVGVIGGVIAAAAMIYSARPFGGAAPPGQDPSVIRERGGGVRAAATATELVKPVSEPLVDRHLDPVELLPRARALARRLEPDAELTGMYFEPITADGAVVLGPAPHLADPTRRSLVYTFVSHARGEDLATTTSAWCAIAAWIDVDGNQISAARSPRSACNDPVIATPRCTARQLWSKARVLGFDPDVPASVTWSNQVRFVGSKHGALQSIPIVDDCPAT